MGYSSSNKKDILKYHNVVPHVKLIFLVFVDFSLKG